MYLTPLTIKNLSYYIQNSRFCFHVLYLLIFSCLFSEGYGRDRILKSYNSHFFLSGLFQTLDFKSEYREAGKLC